MHAPLLLLVGHCRPDTSYLTLSLRKALPQAVVKSITDQQELDKAIATHPADAPPPLLLINRTLEPGFSADSGLDLIRDLHAAHPQLRLMLVSNYPDAQAQAVRLGALHGFGKNDLGSPRLAEVLHDALK